MASLPPWGVIHKQGTSTSSAGSTSSVGSTSSAGSTSSTGSTSPAAPAPHPPWEVHKPSTSPSCAISQPVAPPWKVNPRRLQSPSCAPTAAPPAPQGSLTAAAPPDTVSAAPRKPWKTPKRPSAHVKRVVEKIA